MKTVTHNPSFIIPVRVEGVVAPSFLWTNRFLGDYVVLEPLVDALSPHLLLAARTAKGNELAENPTLVKLRAGKGQVTITPGMGERLTAPVTFFSRWSFALQQLFGYAVSHAFARQGGVYMHGAAFELDRRGVLVLGMSRGGKSTLSALALRTGARVVSDDTVLASRNQEGCIRVEALREELFMREPTQTLLPDALRTGLRRASFSGEHRWILDRSSATSFTRNVQPSIVLCSTIDRRLKATRVRPMTKADVLANLMRSVSPLFLSTRYPMERAAMLPVLAGLASSASGFQVHLGRDLFADPDTTFHRLLDATGLGAKLVTANSVVS